MRIARVLLGLLVSIVSLAASAASPYSAVVVFGDSLSDNGNYYRLVDALTPYTPGDGAPGLPYFFGRFSNGPVAVELLAAKLTTPLVDRAVAGAFSGLDNEDPRLPGTGLLSQVKNYVARHPRLDDDALYFVWAGPNDFFVANLSDPQSAQALIQQVIGNVAQAAALLYQHGARHFLMPNLPDLGLTPMELNANQQYQASALSAAYNAAFGQTLLGLSQAFPGADIRTLDVAGLLQSAVQNPAAFGLLDVTHACVADPSFVCILSSFNAGPAAGYLFWDDIHPTAATHAILASRMFDAVTANVPTQAGEKEKQDKDWLERLRSSKKAH